MLGQTDHVLPPRYSVVMNPLEWMINAATLILVLLYGSTGAAESGTLIDVPPDATQKPYSPADEQRVEVNPPPFIWVPAKKGRVYVLQLSTSNAFPSEATQTFDKLPRSVFVPEQPLRPGRWFWRYGVRKESKLVFGRARPFSVPDDARLFPFPKWDEVVATNPQDAPPAFLFG